MARYKVTPSMKMKTLATEGEAPKRGRGRPRKNMAAPVKVASGKKRGRKPGLKNKTFLEKVAIQADALEAAISTFENILTEAAANETRPAMLKNVSEAAGTVGGLMETLQHVVGALANLPSDYMPGKSVEKTLTWEKGGFVIFKSDAMKAAFGSDAYEIISILELGKGPGNGTMVQLEKGMFPKSQLELIDGDTLEAAIPSAPQPPRNTAPEKKNGAFKAPPPEVVAAATESVAEDDLNA